MKTIPTREENPKGLHQRFVIRKIIGWRKQETMFGNIYQARTKAVDPKAEYFVLRLDKGGSDPKHIEACRKAIMTYATEIAEHLPQLSIDLFMRYGEPK
jgi:hypothetical protein